MTAMTLGRFGVKAVATLFWSAPLHYYSSLVIWHLDCAALKKVDWKDSQKIKCHRHDGIPHTGGKEKGKTSMLLMPQNV